MTQSHLIKRRKSRVPTMAKAFQTIGTKWLPFADAASDTLPLSRLLRLAMFQLTVGMAIVLLNATLNRVMIVEMGISSSLVGLMVSLPLLAAPARLLIGHQSDTHRSYLGWRRVPYIWLGTMLQFGGLAIMPFALILLSGDTTGPAFIGQIGAVVAFLLTGFGLHTTQTAGLALATDIAPQENRGRVVALLYVMLLVGMAVSALVFGWLLSDFSQRRLIQVIQGAAVVTMIFNIIALWHQEKRNPQATHPSLPKMDFKSSWQMFRRSGKSGRLLLATGLGAAAFAMQDILLEPYGGEILGLSVGSTTFLTAILAFGTLGGFAFAARSLSRGGDTIKLAAFGALIGLVAFPAVIFADTLVSATLFRIGVFLIGLGGGLFSVGTLTAAMSLTDFKPKPEIKNSCENSDDKISEQSSITGMALGAWGAVQATAMGLAVSLGGIVRDIMNALAGDGVLPRALDTQSMGYIMVYHIEILLLFATLIALGPLVQRGSASKAKASSSFGLAEFPG